MELNIYYLLSKDETKIYKDDIKGFVKLDITCCYKIFKIQKSIVDHIKDSFINNIYLKNIDYLKAILNDDISGKSKYEINNILNLYNNFQEVINSKIIEVNILNGNINQYIMNIFSDYNSWIEFINDRKELITQLQNKLKVFKNSLFE
jgi:hypothetical protein